MTRSVLIDFETTGLTAPSVADLDKQPRVIEVGVVVYDDGALVKEHSELISPGVEISAEITKITGITNDDLKGRRTFVEVLPTLRQMFADTDFFIAHNAPFDRACLEYELKRAACDDFPWPPNTICSAQEFTHEFGYRPKLTELYERKMGAPLAQTHRALDDIKALAEVLLKEGML